MSEAPLMVAFGGGLNSSAMLVEMSRRGIVADAILFADTGGELPDTYAHVEAFSQWLVEHGQPPIVVVKKGGRVETLEENCLRMKMLPSLAYGFKGCSHKYKIEPQDAWANKRYRDHWSAGGKVRKAIGFGAEETRRAGRESDEKYDYWYPLIEWSIDRAACLASIRAAGAPVPGKSSCFFCPASKKNEIVTLRRKHPDLFARALAMEANAETTSVRGLGRSFAWRDIDRQERDQMTMDFPCGCYDGETDET